MSDAMTNREIEDVLTSVRRLVAQEGTRTVESGRLILTEAQRINAAPVAAETVEDEPASDDAQVSIPAPDFGKLEATIAELEAAFPSADEDDGVDAPRASNVTELYGRLAFVHRGKEGEVATSAPATAAPAPAEAPAPEAAAPEAAAVEPAEVEIAEAPAAPAPAPTPIAAEEQSAYLDAAPNDDPPLAPLDDEAILDEETLRLMVAQIVREELHGQLGERITQQVRKLVRAEIAKALDERNYL